MHVAAYADYAAAHVLPVLCKRTGRKVGVIKELAGLGVGARQVRNYLRALELVGKVERNGKWGKLWWAV
jgi:hypothetical protein